MRLVAIYNAWSDCLDLLKKSIDNILPVVDGVIIVWSNKSNRGNHIHFTFEYSHPKVSFHHTEPVDFVNPALSETMKRNQGIKQARQEGYTHFLMMDSDEFYFAEQVESEKIRMERDNLYGLVCGLKVYIKEPTLWCEDHTLVPFIQKLTVGVSAGDFKHYPFAYDKDRHAHIDPTRRLSHKEKVEWSNIIMHHMSYVRKDINLKIDNSTANLGRSRQIIFDELKNAKPGYTSQLYHKELKECPDWFKIKEDTSRN